MKIRILNTFILLIIFGFITKNRFSEAPIYLEEYFSTAASKHSIPQILLEKIAYERSRWEMRDGKAGLNGSFGIFGLSDYQQPIIADVLKVTSYSRDEILLEPAKHIDATAAYLSSIYKKSGDDELQRSQISSWNLAISKFLGLKEYKTTKVIFDYLNQLLNSQQDWQTLDKQNHTITSNTALLSIPNTILSSGSQATEKSAPTGACTGYDWNATPNYSSRSGSPVRRIVMHTTEGGFSGSVSWLDNPASGASAHYIIRSNDGYVLHTVYQEDKSWTSREDSIDSIGIEMEAFVAQSSYYTTNMLTAAATLVRCLCDRWGIPKTRQYITGHNELGLTNTHVDPGIYWDWEEFIRLVNQQPTPYPKFQASFVSTTGPSTLTEGETRVVKVIMQNDGVNAWLNGEVKLVTSGPTGRVSPFYDSTNWLSNSEVTYADFPIYKAGNLAEFSFQVKAPSVTSNTNYSEKFILIKGSDTFGPEITINFTVNAATAPLALTSATTLPNAEATTAYSFQLSASGGDSNYTFSFLSGNPAWMSISPLGLLTGTPPNTTAAPSIQVALNDGSGTTQATKTFSLTVDPYDPGVAALSFLTTILPNATEGVSYQKQIDMSGGTPPFTFSFASGNPSWLNISNSGLLSGVPTATASFANIIVNVADSATTPQQTNSNTFSLTVDAGAAVTPVSITTASIPAVTSGEGYLQNVLASGGDNGITFSFDASSSHPTWLTLTFSGLLTGVASGSGSYNVVIKACDSISTSTCDTKSLTLTVNAAVSNEAKLVLDINQLEAAKSGTNYLTQLNVSGGTPPYIFSRANLGNVSPPPQWPSWLTLTSSGLLYGDIPNNLDPYYYHNVAIQIIDSASPSNDLMFISGISLDGMLADGTNPSASPKVVPQNNGGCGGGCEAPDVQFMTQNATGFDNFMAGMGLYWPLILLFIHFFMKKVTTSNLLKGIRKEVPLFIILLSALTNYRCNQQQTPIIKWMNDAQLMKELEQNFPVGTGTFTDPKILRFQDAKYPDGKKIITALSADTTNGPSDVANFYAGFTSTGEKGPEWVYKFTMSGKFNFIAALSSTTGDPDIHLLSSNSIISGVAQDLVVRGNNSISQNSLNAGDYYIVVDTWSNTSGTEFPGQFTLAVDIDMLTNQGSGTIANPYLIDERQAAHDGYFYLVTRNTSTSSSDAIDTYNGFTSIEYGPEHVYKLVLTQKYYFSASLDSMSGGVDIDVHLLSDLTISSRQAQNVIARNDKRISPIGIAPILLQPGTYYIICDSYGSSNSKAGSYRFKTKIWY